MIYFLELESYDLHFIVTANLNLFTVKPVRKVWRKLLSLNHTRISDIVKGDDIDCWRALRRS